MVALHEVREFWEKHPIGDSLIHSRNTWYDYFREFDNIRERDDCESYAFSNFIHGYEQSAGLKILDYGCGNGYVLSHYAKHGAEVFGVDITQKAIELTKTRFELMGLKGTFVQNDGQTIPFESNSFDIVSCMGVLMCVEDPTPVVEELYRVLKPDGKIIVMLYHRNSFKYYVTFRRLKYFGPSVTRGKSVQEILNMNDGVENPHNAVYTIQEARQLLGNFVRHTFNINKLWIEELAFHKAFLIKLYYHILPRRFVNFLASRIGWNLYCIAYKAGTERTQ